HLQHGQRSLRHREASASVRSHLGVIADAAQQPVRDPRRAPRALRQLGARPGVNLELQDASRALDDPLQLWLAVEVEPVDRAEAVAHRAAEQPLARGGADAREAWELEAHGARAGPLAGNVVEAEVLKSWVER